MENYYSILEIPESATQEQIKHAYRMLLQVWHPDRFHHNANLLRKAERKAKEINAAFETLSDPTLRRQYDELLKKERKQSATQAHADSEDNEPLTTRCPNPKCDLSLRVQSRSVGKVTCPTCRTTFLYDPVRNEKWKVHCPADEQESSHDTNEHNPPKANAEEASLEKRGVTNFVLIAILSILVVVALIEINPNKSSVSTTLVDTLPQDPPQSKPPVQNSLVGDGVPHTKGQESAKEDAFRLQSGDELIRPFPFSGEGELTVVNDTSLDGVFKLYEEAKDGGTLSRYWFIRAKSRFTLTNIGPCMCSLYFGLGEEWDHDLKGFRFNNQYGKHETALLFRVPKAAEHGEWARYWIPIVEGPSGIESSTLVDEDTFKDLF